MEESSDDEQRIVRDAVAKQQAAAARVPGRRPGLLRQRRLQPKFVRVQTPHLFHGHEVVDDGPE